MTTHIERRLREKQAIEQVYDDLLGEFESGNRALGDWEMYCLRHGLASLYRGLHGLAAVEAEDLLHFREGRPPQAPSGQVTLEQLRTALAVIQGSPPLPYPSFG